MLLLLTPVVSSYTEMARVTHWLLTLLSNLPPSCSPHQQMPPPPASPPAGSLGVLLASIHLLPGPSAQTSSLISFFSEDLSKLPPSYVTVTIPLQSPGISLADFCRSLLFGPPFSFSPPAVQPLFYSQRCLF